MGATSSPQHPFKMSYVLKKFPKGEKTYTKKELMKEIKEPVEIIKRRPTIKKPIMHSSHLVLESIRMLLNVYNLGTKEVALFLLECGETKQEWDIIVLSNV